MSTIWLKANIPGFSDLSLAERRAIADFTMLWTLFEARPLGERGNVAQITQAVQAWDEAGTLADPAYDRALAYFRNRYFEAGAFTEHFNGLHLRPNDRPALVRNVLDGSDDTERSRATAVLIIIFRYRNNLFHGIKWQYRLAGQLENFRTANAVLKHVLKRHGNLLSP